MEKGKHIERNNGCNISKFDENFKPTDAEPQETSNIRNIKNYHMFITIKLFKTNDKEEILKAAKRKNVHYLLGNKNKDNSRFLFLNDTRK